MKHNLLKSIILLFAFSLMSYPLPRHSLLASEQAFISVAGPCGLSFPKDHGPHPGYRLEWWYWTGNLTDENKNPYGFQLTFFRLKLSPSDQAEKQPDHASNWRTNRIFLAHAALTDIKAKKYYHDQKLYRGVLGLADAKTTSGAVSINAGDWQAHIKPQAHLLTVHSSNFSFSLSAVSQKPPVPHGKDGYSKKGLKNESASCYYSLTRMAIGGRLTVNGKRIKVKGTAWMDHEFSSAPLEPDLAGWDWFSLQLSDNTEIMVYLMRHKNGRITKASSATFVSKSGIPTHFSSTDFEVEVKKTWKSPSTGAIYPSQWRLKILPLDIDLNLSPRLKDQEFGAGGNARGFIYWEGSVSISGRSAGKPVRGRGYIEMTGYAEPFNLLK